MGSQAGPAGGPGFDEARLVTEPAKASAAERSPYARDRARVLHSAALRRLAAKTQVVGIGEDDFPRTRLTHSLECAQLGRELAGALGADPDLVDAACLAHDLGHPPFGHNGEAALDALAGPCGGFEGNAQSLRVLTRLETKVLGAGLNLTRATLDAATKYPWPRSAAHPVKYGVYPEDRAVFDWLRAGAPPARRCLEASVMDWADDVAYSVHDLEDGAHAGAIPLHRLDLEAVGELAGLDPAPLRRLTERPYWPARLDGGPAALAALKRLTSELIGRLCLAAVTATRDRYGPVPLRRYGAELVVPAETRDECELLKAVSAHYVMSRRVARQRRQREVVAELVAALQRSAPDGLDPALRPAFAAATSDAARLRVVLDQVASLTDTSAVARHRALLRRGTGSAGRPGRGAAASGRRGGAGG